MKKILVTGMSGTGKSALIEELVARGYKGVDLDDPGYSEYRVVPKQAGEAADRSEWVWREEAVRELLVADDADVLFVAGCASNQWLFYGQFDHIVLLSAPVPVMLERLATRTTNAYGKHPDEVTEVLANHETIEPLLRRVATVEIDSSAPLDQVVAGVLVLIDPPRAALLKSKLNRRDL